MTSETAAVDSSIPVSEPKSEMVCNIDSSLVSVGDDPAVNRESREPSSSEATDDIAACDSMRMYADELTQGIDPTNTVDDVMSEKSSDQGRRDDPLTLQIDPTQVCKTSSAGEPRLSPRVTLITVNEKDIVDEKRFPIKAKSQLEEDKTPLTVADPLEVAEEKINDSSTQVPSIEPKPEEPKIAPKQALESEEAEEPISELSEAKAVEESLPPAEKDEVPSPPEVKGTTEKQLKEVAESVDEVQSQVDESEPQKVSEPSKEETRVDGAEAPSAGSAPPLTPEMNAQDPEKETVIINEATSSDAPNISTKLSTKKGSHHNVHATFKPSKFLKKFAQKHHTEDKKDNESVRVAGSEQATAIEVFEAKEETKSTADVRSPGPEKCDAETTANATPYKRAMVKGALSSTQKSFRKPKFMRKFSAKHAEGHEPKADVASDANTTQETPDYEAQKSMKENDSVQTLVIEPESAKEAFEGNDENASNSGVFASEPEKSEDMTAEPRANASAMKAAIAKEALSSTHLSLKKPKFLRKFSAKESEGREPNMIKKVFIKKPKEDIPIENTEENKTEKGVVQEAALELTPMVEEKAKESSQESTIDTESTESMAETPVDNVIAEELEHTVTEERKDTVQIITTVTPEISAILGDQSGCEKQSCQTLTSKAVVEESVIENKVQLEPTTKSTVEDNPEATTFLGFSISNITENLFCKTEQYLGDFTSICAPRSVVETSEKGEDMVNSNEWGTKFTSLCAPKPSLNTDAGAPEAPETEVGRWDPERFTSLCAPNSGADNKTFEASKTEPNSNEGYSGDLTSLCGPKATAETGSVPDAEFKGVDATLTETPDQSPGFHEKTEKNVACENYLDNGDSAECKSTEETSVVEVPSANAKDETNTEDEAVSNDEEPKELKVEESVAEEMKLENIKSKAQNPSSEHAKTEHLGHESNVELTTDDLCKLEAPLTDTEEGNEETKPNLIASVDNSTSQEKPIESTTCAESTTAETTTSEFNTAESTMAEFSLISSVTPEAARSAEAKKPVAEEVTASERGSTKMQKASLFKRLGKGRAQPTTLKTDDPESVDANISVSPSKRGKFKFLVSKKK